mgnify:CR=1 FL=1
MIKKIKTIKIDNHVSGYLLLISDFFISAGFQLQNFIKTPITIPLDFDNALPLAGMVKHSRNQPAQQEKYWYNQDYRHNGKMVCYKPEHSTHHIAKHRLSTTESMRDAMMEPTA